MTTQKFIVEITADFTLPESTVELIFKEWVRRNNKMGMPMYLERVTAREEKGMP